MSFGHKKTEHFLLDMKQTRKKMHEKHEADYHAIYQLNANKYLSGLKMFPKWYQNVSKRRQSKNWILL